jgi:branched-chain amino acid aminotransferase
MQEVRSIWHNGRLVPWAEATIHVMTHGLHYGSGAFEGIRAYEGRQGTHVLGLDQHVGRLVASCRALRMDLPWTAAEVRQGILDVVRDNELGACYIRPIAYVGYHKLGIDPVGNPIELAIAAYPWGAYHGEGLTEGVDVGVSSWQRMAPNTHQAMVKATGNYVNSMLALLEAKRHGYAEGLMLDQDGYVCEGSGENLFLVKDGGLITPPIGASILAGITREFVLQLAADRGLTVTQERLPREMLMFAEELFMTGTAAEITPIRSVDRLPIGEAKPGPITRSLQEEFFGILGGEKEDRHGWLTPVE